MAAYLARLHENRDVDLSGNNAVCVCDSGSAHVQFLAPAHSNILYAEAASERFLPPGRLNAAKVRVLRELGFHRIQREHKVIFCQEIPVRRDADLIRAARIAYRVFAEVYNVKDFSAVRSTLKIPEDDEE
ncbi:MAG: TY-Chap domain-containing protein [Stellaceae bacterium]